MSSKNRRRGTISYNSRFKMGKLPVEHLVVPLITGKLTIHDCMPSLDKISSRIQHWATKLLFFAGRQQLVSSVIFSLQNYWCTIFILPSQVIKSIESKCNSFLWKGKDTSVVGAKVA